jgi:zinc protease
MRAARRASGALGVRRGEAPRSRMKGEGVQKRFHRITTSVLVILACSVAAQAPVDRARKSSSDVLRLPFESYTLPNGLTVILSTDHSTPTVAVNVWYHVGSKNEAVGRTGFAHLFEHVMFTGSGNIPYGTHDKLTEGVGGSNNGTTDNDRTTYFETVPANYLETMLWLESDRMGFLLNALDLAKLNAQRDIVKNERRQRVDNQPYGRVSEILSHTTYPSTHPYSWSVIGSMEDLSAASEEDVKNFFRLYYAPNNAYLAIVGDFDPAQAKAWVEKYFGSFPRGKAITRPTVSPVTLSAEKRLVYEDRVQVPRLYVLWPTIGVKNDDRFALDVLAEILAGSRTARISKPLVYDEQSAASASARQDTSEDVGEFVLTVTPRPGHTLTNLEASADAIIERLKSEGPTAEEIQKAVAGLELAFIRGLESNLGKSFQLAEAAGYHGDPGAFQRDYQKTLAVTAADVKRVATKYLTRGRVVLSVVPQGKLDQAAKPDQSVRVSDYDEKKPGGGR